MTTLLLTQKIFSLFLVIGAGVLIVKCGVLSPDDSKVLSRISVYLIFPCVMINAFLVEYTKEIQDGIRLAFTAAILVHIGFNLPAVIVLAAGGDGRAADTPAGVLILVLFGAIGLLLARLLFPELKKEDI